MIFINCNTAFTQSLDSAHIADSLHGLILKPEILGVERPADMFVRNCADCHTEAIMYYTRYSQLWDTTFKSRDKYIHTWIRPIRNDTSAEIQLLAKGINVFNDTTPVKNAMIEVSIRNNLEWIPINSQILLTDNSGKATLKINEELVAFHDKKNEILVQLVDNIVYPNGKYRIRVNWDMKNPVYGEEYPLDVDNSKNTSSRLGLLIVIFMISTVILLFYYLYQKFLS